MLAAHEMQDTSALPGTSERVYWLKKLSGRLPDATWFVHSTRNRDGRKEWKHYAFEIPDLQRVALRKLSKASDLSLYVILVAVLKLLLYKYSGETDTIVLSPVYRPGQPDNTGNKVPLRTNITGCSTFKNLLGAVKQTIIEAYTNQELTVTEIAELVGLLPADDQCAFSNVTVLLENIHANPVVANEPGDLIFSFKATAERLVCNLTYASSLFSKAQMERIGSQYLTALANALERIDATVTDIGVLTPQELQIVGQLNRTVEPSSTDLSVAELFRRQAAATPDRIAAVFEHASISYSQLDHAANGLASRLTALGVGLESVVALFGDRGINYLSAILAVFKAGAAYFPLDPAHPVERITQVLNSSGARVVVVAEPYREKLERVLGAIAADDPFTVISFEESGAGDTPPHIPSTQSYNASLSYVLYTSGSTGRPKGAMIEMAGMRNHLFAKIDDLALSAGDVVAQNASQCFDISVWQFLAALLVGGTVQIISDDCTRNPEALLKQIATSGTTVLQLVPSQLRTILDELSTPDFATFALPRLRCVVATGEALPAATCREWLMRFSDKPIVNAWGPTEASDDITHFHIAGVPEDTLSVPIGRTLPNTSAYLLDRDLSHVPLDVPGEIYVGGIGVGRGYLGEPQKTAAAFIPDPFSEKPGSRLYKTGDLGCYHADGNIDFLGRVDHQVKVRGYRIELGEIQAALALHEKVREVAVLAREDEPGEKRLVAYVVLNPDSTVSVSELRAFLNTKLPDYMIPSAIVTLQSFPRTPNGKLDRNNLPAPDSSRPELGGCFLAPRSHVEQMLAQIWAQVLGVSNIGINDNFFELGGDSILCIQAVAKARQAGFLISPQHIFQSQTIRELAQVVGELQGTAPTQGPISGEVPLTPIQRWFFDLDFNNPNLHNHAVTFEIRERPDTGLLRTALATLLQHHDALRLRFSKQDGQWVQFNSAPDESVPFSVVDLSDTPVAAQEQVARQIAAALHKEINLEGPLFASRLFDFGTAQPAILLLVAHHLVVDAVSWRIIQDDLQTVYEQLANGKPVTLPHKTTSYKQWAERLVEYAQSPTLEAESEYWSASISNTLERLPVDCPGGNNTVASTRTISVELDPKDTQSLLQDVTRVYGAQINEVLLASLTQAISNWSGQSRVRIDLESHGRATLFEDLDLTRTVGWFTAIYPVVFQTGMDWRPKDFLESAKKQLRRVPKDGTGFGLLRYLNRNPRISDELKQRSASDISFNYLGQLDRSRSASETFAWQSISIASDHNRSRGYLLDINGFVSGGKLQLSIGYSANLHKATTIENLTQNYLLLLKDLIESSKQGDQEEISALSFSGATLSEEQLDEVLSLVS